MYQSMSRVCMSGMGCRYLRNGHSGRIRHTYSPPLHEVAEDEVAELQHGTPVNGD